MDILLKIYIIKNQKIKGQKEKKTHTFAHMHSNFSCNYKTITNSNSNCLKIIKIQTSDKKQTSHQ